MEDDPEPDPQAWYLSEFDEEPQYSRLLEQLGPEGAERQSLLKGYFEPTAVEREEGVKTPTDAHRAIAGLVAEGWIRVIVTTNFDKLIEAALSEAGITPRVISRPGEATGATPLAHSSCTVIKVHGDYMDPEIKNSKEELATFEAPMNKLLERVFDEYGLVVCGWSATDDVALRSALERCESRRYTTYWCARSRLSPAAERLVANRAAQVVQIDSADSFFTTLEERVASIVETGQRHPLETRAAVETLKRYLVEDRHRIRLRELVKDSNEELVSHLNVEEFPISTQRSDEEIASRVQKLNPLCEQVVALVANGCFYGTPEQDDVWLGAVRRLADVEVVNPRANNWGEFFGYPALLALYAAGIAVVAEGKYSLLAKLLLEPIRSPHRNETAPVVQALYPEEILPERAAHVLFPHRRAGQKHFAPRRQYIHQILRAPFADLIASDDDYHEAFDRFEYLALLVESDFESRRNDSLSSGRRWFGVRAFAFGVRVLQIAERVGKEGARELGPLVEAGLFDGDPERLLAVKQTVDNDMARAQR